MKFAARVGRSGADLRRGNRPRACGDAAVLIVDQRRGCGQIVPAQSVRTAVSGRSEVPASPAYPALLPRPAPPGR